MQVINTEAIEAVAAENCLDQAAFVAFLNYESFDDDADAVEAFQDAYAGTFDDLEAWAEEFADDTGMLSEVPENLRPYFNFEAWARDCELSGDVWTADTPSGTAVFWNR